MDCSDSAQGVTLSLACPVWASAAPETASTSQNGRKAYAAICRHAEQEWRNGPFTGFCECLDVLMRHVSQVLSNTGFSAPQFCQDAFLVLCPFLLGPRVWQQVTCVTWQAMFLNFALRCVKFGRTPRRCLQTAKKIQRCNTTFIMVRVSLLQSTELSSHIAGGQAPQGP